MMKRFQAASGSFRQELEDDYAKMRGMIFGTPPSLDDVLAVIADIERQVNASR